jgi:hypothetical protein
MVDPGQTVAITEGSLKLYNSPVTITRSGTPTEPITFTYGTGIDPVLYPLSAIGITFKNVHDVSVTSLDITSVRAAGAVVREARVAEGTVLPVGRFGLAPLIFRNRLEDREQPGLCVSVPDLVEGMPFSFRIS